MGRILDAAKAFFETDGWPYEEADEMPVLRTGFRTDAEAFEVFLQEREEEEQVLVYAMVPFEVPTNRTTAVVDYMTRANFGLVLGAFEMDLDDGEARFRTSMDLEGVDANETILRNLVYACVFTLTHYLPGLRRVALEGMDPAAALQAAEEEAESAGEERYGEPMLPGHDHDHEEPEA